MSQDSSSALPDSLTAWDAVAVIVGIVIGASVFRTPGLVAENAGSVEAVVLAWVLGAAVSVVGALCYAELATTYPHAGGDYHYFDRAYGEWVAFLFAWARLSVIQTGSIALLAFVFGDYASELLSLGPYSSSVYASAAVIALTGLNMSNVRFGKGTQQVLTLATVIGLLVLTWAGISGSGGAEAAVASAGSGGSSGTGSFGMAMVFVLLTYGGWNEAAFVSAELQDVRSNMARSLFLSIAVIATLYVLVNVAYLQGLGLEGMSGSDVVAADLMRTAWGETGATLLSLLVVCAALSSTNATIFTGARTNLALGRDFHFFRFLGRWDGRGQTPANALLVQGLVALALVGLGAATRQGFESMVDYTAPVFWLFFGLTGASLLVLRARDPDAERPFRVPFYPWTPLVFCAACVYMLWSSLAYTGVGAVIGAGILLLGVPLLLVRRRSSKAARPS